jgi:hypothetical protein
MQNGNKPNRSIHIREKCKKLKKILVYTGSIENGMDLMRIEMILSYSERKEEVKSSNKRHRFYNTS